MLRWGIVGQAGAAGSSGSGGQSQNCRNGFSYMYTFVVCSHCGFDHVFKLFTLAAKFIILYQNKFGPSIKVIALSDILDVVYDILERFQDSAT